MRGSGIVSSLLLLSCVLVLASQRLLMSFDCVFLAYFWLGMSGWLPWTFG